MKAFPIDFVRQIIEQTMYENKIKNENLIGGENQLCLFSFYEHLTSESEVDRYVSNYRDLTNQQNKTDIVANGVIVSPENPTITNLNQTTIIPLTYTCSFRCTLKNRDIVMESINSMIKELKGRKVDVAEFGSGKLFKVGTVANNSIGKPRLRNGDYVGEVNGDENVNTEINTLLVGFNLGKFVEIDSDLYYVYYTNTITNELCVAYKNNGIWQRVYKDDTLEKQLPFPSENAPFEKYKVSLSFETIRCNEPMTLNSEEYCTLSFGGSATIVSNGVLLGNDLTKVGISKSYIVSSPKIDMFTEKQFLEPLELPSTNSLSTIPNQLKSNNFLTNSHANSIAGTIQYTFVVDTNIPLLKQLFDFARYGTTLATADGISPNMVFGVDEYWSSWGVVELKPYLGKIYGSVEIENTESDTLTLSLSFQIQGANN